MPAIGLMHSDHRQPGCNVIRAAFTEPRSTTSTSVLSGVRRSSGDSKLFFTTPAIVLLQFENDRIVVVSASAALVHRLRPLARDRKEHPPPDSRLPVECFRTTRTRRKHSDRQNG